jgi:hypothetical protein
VENNWPDNLTIQQYLEGKLNKKLMHALEEKALDDPFLADALEGYSNTPVSDHGLSILQRQLHERISHQQENKKVFDLSWQRLSIAAAAAVMFITAGVLFWMNGQLPAQKIAANRKQVEVNIAPVDSLTKGGAKVTNMDHQPVVTERMAMRPLHETRNYNKRQVIKSKTSNSIEDNSDLIAGVSRKNETNVSTDQEGRLATKIDARSDHARTMKAMAADSHSLSEVIIIPSKTISRAYPAEGWEAYNRYLKEKTGEVSALLKQKGQVVLGFKVDETGALKDFKVLQGVSPATDSLAKEIIKAGPAWKADPDGKVSDLRIVLDF